MSKRLLIETICGRDTELFINQYGNEKLYEVSLDQLEEDILDWSSTKD
jgi:hypothetical protein